MPLANLIARRAEESPDAPALLAPGRPELTFQAFRTQVERTARQLASFGITSSDRVAIVLPNGPEMAVAFVAAASCAASAPLNPAYRAKEYDFYLEDLDAAALIVAAGSDSPAVGVARERGVPLLEISVDENAAAGTFDLTRDGIPLSADPDTPLAEPDPDDIALILHTSGTTSRPKMVPLSRRNLVRSAENIRETLALTPDDRCLNVMPLFHIHGLAAAVLASVTAGAATVATPGFDAGRFYEWLDEFAPTWYTAVPTMHQGLLARSAKHAEVIARRPLRFIRSCSASLPPSVMAELEETFSAPVLEAYGMTEAAHQMTCNPLPPMPHKPGSVGPAAGPEVAIMDAAGRMLATGEKGEVVIRGDNVTTGYASNPEANATAFTDGWFRTGDEGYFDEDGYLFLTGRLKEMINRAGEKVSPREIDEVLLEHPTVAQALSFAMPDPRVGEEIAAALVIEDGVTFVERDLLAFAADRLADFKLPRKFVVLDAIPKGPTGKLQRIGLAEKLGLTGDDADGEAASDEPSTNEERALGDLAAEVLEIDRVRPHDDFFALGGDSIMATRFVLAASSVLGRTLPVHALFLKPTIAGLIAYAAESDLEDEVASIGLDVGEEGPTTLAQDMLWIQERIRPGTLVNHRPGAIRIDGPLDLDALADALFTLRSRHAGLRTRLPVRVSRPFSIVDEPWREPLETLDLTGVDAPQAREREFTEEFVRRPFDLETGPLARFAVVRHSAGSHRLLTCVHHAVFDAWSMSVLARELSALLGHETLPLAPALAAADLAAWERRRESTGGFDRGLTWWSERLADLEPMPLPIREDADATKEAGAEKVLRIPGDVARMIEARGREDGLTPFMAYLALFETALARWCGTEEVVVGTLVAGRDRPGAENLIGMFINEIVLRTDLAGKPDARETMRRVRADVRDAFARQDVPFSLVVRALKPPVRPGRNPLFDVLFQMKPFPLARHEAGEIRLTEEELFAGVARSDLFLELTPGDDGMSCRFEYRTAMFDERRIADLIESFEADVRGFAG